MRLFLHDIFASINRSGKSLKTSYILQFLWRDLTSTYSIIGPHFECEKSWDHCFLYECVLRTIKLFSLYKVLIRVLVCDGASSNVALLKVLSGYPPKRLPYSENGNGINKYFPRMTFKNPFDPTDDNVVYMIICPSHQVCHQSQLL